MSSRFSRTSEVFASELVSALGTDECVGIVITVKLKGHACNRLDHYFQTTDYRQIISIIGPLHLMTTFILLCVYDSLLVHRQYINNSNNNNRLVHSQQ